MKKILLAASLAIGLVSGCWAADTASYYVSSSVWSYTPEKGVSQQTMEYSSAGLKNPFLYYQSIQDLEKEEGTYPLPSYMPESYMLQNISMLHQEGKSFAQLIYRDKENRILYRVSKTMKDLNGDQREYVKTNEIIDDVRVFCLGTREGVYVMQWQEGDFYCCVMSDVPLSHREMILIKRGVK